jgi:predicted MPP superfamily phosphohydrolase
MSTRLVIIPDAHVDGPGPRADLLRRAIAKAVELNPATVVLLGDTVENGKPEEYALAQEIVKPVRLLIRSLPGNHELLKGTINDFRKTWLVEPATADLIDNLPVMRFNSAVGGQSEEEYFGRVTPDQLRLLNALLSARPTLPALSFRIIRSQTRFARAINFSLRLKTRSRSATGWRLTRHRRSCSVVTRINRV